MRLGGGLVRCTQRGRKGVWGGALIRVRGDSPLGRGGNKIDEKSSVAL